MESFQQRVLLVYAGLVLLATILASARRWIRPHDQPSDVWRKYPAYLALAAAFFLVVWSPHSWHALGPLLALIGFFCSRELNRALALSVVEAAGLASAGAGLILAAEFLQPASFIRVWLVLATLTVAAGSLTGRRDELGQRMLGIGASLGLFPWCLASIIWLRQSSTGDFLAIFLYTVIATNDAFAQIIGQLIGKRLLAPAISPGKTVGGVTGGLTLAALLGAILFVMIGWPYVYGALIGGVVALAGLIGDLTVSGWKRFLGLKDFSQNLGAHGGVLDRFDSLIFAAPVLFLMLGR